MRWVRLPVPGSSLWVSPELLLAAMVNSYTDEDTPSLAMPVSDITKTIQNNERFSVQLAGAEVRLLSVSGEPWTEQDASMRDPVLIDRNLRDEMEQQLREMQRLEMQHRIDAMRNPPRNPAKWDPYSDQFAPLPESLIRALEQQARQMGITFEEALKRHRRKKP